MVEPAAFGRLVDLAPREAWGHEAHAFTPWLAANIDRLAEAVGMELELTGQEVRVERFAADILARDPSDGSVVLIENQLEATDHTHLGQILTYLAGLDARAVIWIAPEFREPHLSAVRWLNQHTAEGFSFFAVRLRVVRIGESPMAPVFEVVERPNGWERRLVAETHSGGMTEIGERRRRFWEHVAARDPDGMFQPKGWPHSPVEAAPGVIVVSWIGKRCCGTFVRPAQVGDDLPALQPHREALGKGLGASPGGGDKWFASRGPGSIDDPATWDAAADWLIDARRRYLGAIRAVLTEPVP